MMMDAWLHSPAIGASLVRLGTLWFLLVVGWTTARGGMRVLSIPPMPPMPAATAVRRSLPVGRLGALRLMAGCLLLALAGRVAVPALLRFLDSMEPLEALIMLVPVLFAATAVENLGRRALMRLPGRSRGRPPLVTLGAGNCFIAALAMGLGGWLLLRTPASRTGLAGFVAKVPGDMAAITFTGSQGEAFFGGLAVMALGHVCLTLQQIRQRTSPSDGMETLLQGGDNSGPQSGPSAEARLAEARYSRFWPYRRRTSPLPSGILASLSGRGWLTFLGVILVLVGMVLAIGAGAGAVVAPWQGAVFGLFALLSFARALYTLT